MLPKDKKMMPLSFRPHEFSVVIGKGKDARRAPGTRRLRAAIESRLQDYKMATRRLDKAMIVSDLLFQQQLRCPNGGTFVKFDGKVWWELSEHDARENITAAFRNRLHENYKSSSKYKSAKRRSQLKLKAAEAKKKISTSAPGARTDTSYFPSSDLMLSDAAIVSTRTTDQLSSLQQPIHYSIAFGDGTYSKLQPIR